jgi:hypothetical protein
MRYIETFGLALPLSVVEFPNNWLLVTTCYNRVKVRDNMIWLWRIALVLGVILVDLGLGILWHSSLICSSGIIVVSLAGWRILPLVSALRIANLVLHTYAVPRHDGRNGFLF